jgi:hypothetical protein
VSADTPATRAAAASGLRHEVVEYGRVDSIEEAALARGVELHRVIKSIVVRRGEGDLVMVLVPGDRVIDWPRLRGMLGVSDVLASTARLSYLPAGTITPLVAIAPVIDALRSRLVDREGSGVAINVGAAELVAFLGAVVADVTKPA